MLHIAYCDVQRIYGLAQIMSNILKVERQSETLDSIKCHTFPGLGGKALDILLHDSTLQNKIVPSVLIEMQAHTNSFIVIPARLVHARARQFDLRTSKST